MGFQPRIPEKFTSIDGSTYVWTFPTAEYEWQPQQPLYAPMVPITGANYSYDLLQNARAVKQDKIERILFSFYQLTDPGLVDTEVDNAFSTLIEVGRGKLWALDSDGNRRWEYARALMIPTVDWKAGDIFMKPVSEFQFEATSDWYDENAYDDGGGFDITSDPQSVVITNPGNQRVFNAIFKLSGTYSSPVITNLTNSYKLTSFESGASSSDQVRFDAGRSAVEVSADGGATWAGDWANFTMQTGQIQLIVLEPGDNTIKLEGCNGATLNVSFYGAWA